MLDVLGHCGWLVGNGKRWLRFAEEMLADRREIGAAHRHQRNRHGDEYDCGGSERQKICTAFLVCTLVSQAFEAAGRRYEFGPTRGFSHRTGSPSSISRSFFSARWRREAKVPGGMPSIPAAAS